LKLGNAIVCGRANLAEKVLQGAYSRSLVTEEASFMLLGIVPGYWRQRHRPWTVCDFNHGESTGEWFVIWKMENGGENGITTDIRNGK